jgi:hypothetical protein
MSRSKFKRDRLRSNMPKYESYTLALDDDLLIRLYSNPAGNVFAERNGEPITITEARQYFDDTGAWEADILEAAFAEGIRA